MLDLDPYLQACDIIDWTHPALTQQALILADNKAEQTVLNCYHFVRDQIEHSVDFQRDGITVSASDVLHSGHGLCFGKSHLLVALLRANGIAAGLCYQRLRWDGPASPYCLHGLAAFWLAEYGWTRCDPRGNTHAGVNADCVIGQDQFSFAPQLTGERLFTGIWAKPWPQLIAQLSAQSSLAAFCAAPPDLAPPELTLVASLCEP